MSDEACSMNVWIIVAKNGTFDLTTVECCPNVDSMAPVSVSWRLHTRMCEVREVASVEEGHDVERVADTMRDRRRQLW